MSRLFGTDGVRGVANSDLTPDLALALGRAAGWVLASEGGEIVLGRDTRLSGPMLEGALVAGLCSAGARVRTAGILPTPAVAFLTIDEKARAGAVLSASHNPVPDNGIKFFSAEGTKVTSDIEERIEAAVAEPPTDLPTGSGIGVAEELSDGLDRYVDHVLSSIDQSLEGLRVVLDCAYGAAWKAGPQAFREAGADLVVMNAEPDGARINVDCGSTSLDSLRKRVVTEGADIGFGFDGDADRVLAVDDRGEEVDGDRIISLLALHLHNEGMLKNNIVVSTVMANLAFRRHLEASGIEVVAAPVGDKFVAEAMQESGAVLGGEQSGHVIMSEHSTTGDGILTALHVAAVVRGTDRSLSDLAHPWERYPQVLINVEVADKGRLESEAALWDEVRRVERLLGDSGRVLLRPSGTEPKVRVMVEAADAQAATDHARALADAVRKHLG